MLPVKSVLWPTDGSEPSFAALEKAVAICKENNAKLYALQVVQEVPILATGIAEVPVATNTFNVEVYQQELVNMTRQQIEQLVKDKVPSDIDVETQVLSGEPAHTINTFAEENSIDMIVMATQGRTGLTHLLLGSVTESTIRHATRPLLVVPTGRKND